MNDTPLLSIIVPVYNSEEYLERAFNTVISQSFCNFELILVNDGSTDNSPTVCQAFANLDKRIKYFTKENGGLCSARNYGIDKATGEYIMFMDNDDEYVQDAFNTIAKVIEEYHPDIVRFNRKRIQIFDDESQKMDIYGTKGIADTDVVLYTRSQFFNNYKEVRRSGCFAGIWNGAFKRSLFKSVRFDETITAGGEDAIVNLQLYSLFQTIVFLPEVLYIYFRRTKHSVSTKFQFNQVIALGKESSIERQLIHDNGLKDEDYFSYAYVHLASIVKVLNHKNSTLSKSQKMQYMDSLSKEYYGFNFTTKDIDNTRIPAASKLYMKLYTEKKYNMLFFATDLIMRLRGNA